MIIDSKIGIRTYVPLRHKIPGTLRSVLTTLEQNHGSLSLHDAALRLNLSPGRFRHWFRAEIGNSYQATRQIIKLSHGAMLLIDTSDTIGDIATVLNYADRSKFEKAFKKAFGITPVRYRQLYSSTK